MRQFVLEIMIATVALLSLGYATARADGPATIENPFYIACSTYHAQSASSQHTVDVIMDEVLSRSAATEEDRYQREHGTFSCTRALRLALQFNALDLRGRGLGDIAALGGLTNLTTLIIDDNNIVDISPLVSLGRLEYLSAAHNTINEVTRLEHLPNLRFLTLAHNNIHSIVALGANSSLVSVDVRANPVTDFVHLQLDRPTLRVVGP